LENLRNPKKVKLKRKKIGPKHQVQTEIGATLKVKDSFSNSNKEIFLRELISNASDAIDKFNYLKLQMRDLKMKIGTLE